ncbi:hypothetical protein MKW94_003657 [Papaver nudicaule]|uniref:Uncharacterized protein n=1 Tax=Papaver nudicaule TaxID=74823 RepID=A0AA41S5G6_PAPNU|nr:hypothetical protein [Papaver nudicaule]
MGNGSNFCSLHIIHLPYTTNPKIQSFMSFRIGGQVYVIVMMLLPKLPLQPQLLQTVCLTIGAYSKWLDTSPNGLPVLPSVIEILMSGMSASEDSAAAAALAFRHICDDCRQKFCGSLDGLFHIYHRAVYFLSNLSM